MRRRSRGKTVRRGVGGKSRGAVRPLARIWCVAALAALVPVALAAANDVSISRAGVHEQAIGVNDKKPNDCDSMTLTGLVEGSVSVSGGTQSELLLGSSLVDMLDGAGGDDCLVAGGGDDSLAGGPGVDVCVGGPGTDSFDATCETQVD